ncbi:restriction endonuclease subunit S [Propioniciclava tarda]|uniref:Type I restriction modification DNA specificity domain-containing protein n=1 Tax=Propioniciclava tarda TaxID=433330 RepID=A0A4Q9KQQ2_PROTD|nr:restriction endonuclease subunit S [Propioniciclava tarda]TBT96400.1 hypothetical protein ET996_01750 [Propioniciclava tarda]SMO37317.1 type I restriction enzyme, S subunit [Propioniciclava tarda]
MRPYLRKMARVGPGLRGEYASTGFCVLRPNADLDPDFLYRYVESQAFEDQVLPLQKGVSYPAVLDREVRSCQIAFPGLTEQRRIVEIIEDHFSRLDAAERSIAAGLEKVEAMVAVALAAAGTGPMTPLTQTADIQGGIQKTPARAPREHPRPFLRVANVTAEGLNLDEIHYVEASDDEVARLSLRAGDLLVVEGNGSPSQIGRAAVWDGSIEGCLHQNHLIRVRPREGLLPEYLEIVWNSPIARRRLSQVASSSSGLHTLSVRKLSQLSFPVPSVADQSAVVSYIQELRQQSRRLTNELLRARTRSTSLRRAILAAAFSGRLTGSASDADRIEELASAAPPGAD